MGQCYKPDNAMWGSVTNLIMQCWAVLQTWVCNVGQCYKPDNAMLGSVTNLIMRCGECYKPGYAMLGSVKNLIMQCGAVLQTCCCVALARAGI